MDENLQILLNSTKNIDSVNVDTHNKIELSNKRSLLHEYEIKNVLSATEVFNIEREANAIYRIYGKIEYISLLNGLKNNYLSLSDFFLPEYSGNSKNLLNSFDFYLVKAGSGYTQIVSGGSTILWRRHFQVIATPNEFEIYPVGFANNVFGEQTYAFNFNIDFDVSDYFDHFGFPATELFLYVQYKKPQSPPNPFELLSFIRWDDAGIPIPPTPTPFNPITFNIGDNLHTDVDYLIGDLIEESDSQFFQAQLTPQTFYITTPYFDGANKQLRWKYNPFIPLRLRYFSEEVSIANISGTSYEQTSMIPSYAIEYPVGTGNYVWRTIMEQGYIDPLTGLGVDYPFVNKKRYLFSNIMLSVTPDFTHANTFEVFKHIQFGASTLINKTPAVDDLNNIGKPCQ